ncbi:hypothetical protein, partial [Ralstonia solanacearum]|uniref:hypothetical protein n=1 Tax=Ralstonia solanacearum TaxID=305 RepID=UPI0035E5A06F
LLQFRQYRFRCKTLCFKALRIVQGRLNKLSNKYSTLSQGVATDAKIPPQKIQQPPRVHAIGLFAT